MTEIIERKEVKELRPKEYAFVIDINGRKLAPTNINKAWILIRKHKAILISKYSVVIQLKREINDTELDESEYICGIDDGSKHIGVSIVQKCSSKRDNRIAPSIKQKRQDNCKCMECKKTNSVLEAHHITPRRLKGSNTISNLITLCSNCHDKTEGKEELFISKYESMVNGKSIRFDYAQHVMQGKSYLRNELSKLGNLI